MKIGIVGCGQVGATSAYACVLNGVGTEIVLVDKNQALAEAQARDILHATPFAHPVPCRAGDYADLAGAAIVMIAAGVSQKPGETRLDLLKRNTDIFAQIIPPILKAAPGTILLNATNPVDIMTHMTERIASQFDGHDPCRVIGSGTILDTARFRSLLGQHLGVSSHSVHANVLGEHGDSEVLHWSGASIGNVPLANFASQVRAPVTAAVRRQIDQEVRGAAYSIIKGKGATWFGVGAGMARIARAILSDEHTVLTCTAPTLGIEGLPRVSLSVPRLIGRRGIESTIHPELDEEERQAFQKSAEVLWEATEKL